MELAEPSIATAFDRCVEPGATTVVVFPYFLLPGRHWNEDIPRLAAAAARQHPGVRYLVTAPFGLHPLMAEVMRQRIEHCLAHTAGRSRCLRAVCWHRSLPASRRVRRSGFQPAKSVAGWKA